MNFHKGGSRINIGRDRTAGTLQHVARFLFAALKKEGKRGREKRRKKPDAYPRVAIERDRMACVII